MIDRPTAYPPNGIPFKDRVKKEEEKEQYDFEYIEYKKESLLKRVLKKLRLTK